MILHTVARTPFQLVILLCCSAALSSGCGRVASSLPRIADPAAHAPFLLVDVADGLGVRFRHSHGSSFPLKIVESLGSGCAFLDFDGDGKLDIFLVNAGQDFQQSRQEPGSRLYRNLGFRFEDVTESSGLRIDGYAMGCCAGDYDNDGRIDLFVTGLGRNWLFHNEGSGRFKEVSESEGILRRPGAWGMGCAFLDVNGDGRLDLYVANYVRYDPALPFCATGAVKHGCTPNQYRTQPNELYMNLGNGRFAEKAGALGADNPTGAGLGVIVCTVVLAEGLY